MGGSVEGLLYLIINPDSTMVPAHEGLVSHGNDKCENDFNDSTSGPGHWYFFPRSKATFWSGLGDSSLFSLVYL